MDASATTSSQRGTIWLWAGAASGLLAAYLLLFAPNQLLGIDTGLVGSALLLLAGWSAAYGLSASRANPDSLITLGEKQAWIALITTAAVGAYLLYKLAGLGWTVDLHSRALRKIATNSVAMLVGAAILARLLRQREAGATLEDERDRAIRQRAASDSHGVLLTLLIGLVVTLGLTPVDRLPFSSPIAIAHALIGVLLLSELARHAAEVWRYRQERQ
jgi:hypothetical protein